MSKPQVSSRPFFSFGNPFRMVSPKSSQLSPKLDSFLNSFEKTLAERLRKLIPKNNDDVISLTWMKSAMESLCETHMDIKSLIADLELPVTDWDDKWVDMYLDISVKLLDMCNAFISELTRLNQGHLSLQCAMHHLESGTSNQFVRARASFDSWRQHIGKKNLRVENCGSILDSLVGSLSLPKVKNSTKGKVLMRAMYGVKVHTVFVCSVLAAAFSGSSKNLIDLNVPTTSFWGQTYCDLQTNVNGKVRERFYSGKFTILKELDGVDSAVKELYPKVQDGLAPAELEAFKTLFSDLGKLAENLSLGLDVLAKKVDDFFNILLTGRDALLGNLRVSDSITNAKVNGAVDQQVVR